jgi:hypothetical protein
MKKKMKTKTKTKRRIFKRRVGGVKRRNEEMSQIEVEYEVDDMDVLRMQSILSQLRYDVSLLTDNLISHLVPVIMIPSRIVFHAPYFDDKSIQIYRDLSSFPMTKNQYAHICANFFKATSKLHDKRLLDTLTHYIAIY